jgi:hypothetical protein
MKIGESTIENGKWKMENAENVRATLTVALPTFNYFNSPPHQFTTY